MYFGNVVAEMAKLGVSQREMADILEMTPTTFSLKLNCKNVNKTFDIYECIVIKNYLNSLTSTKPYTLDYLFKLNYEEDEK